MNMTLRSTGLGWLGVIVGISVLIGCGPSRPETVPVSGSVTLDGKPVENASVAFFPVDGGLPARGMTDASGKFTLMTFVAGDGALPGNHRVSVTKSETVTTAPAVEVGGDQMETPTDGGAAENVKHLLPIEYSSPSSSQLSVEVKKGMGPVALDLKSK
jgi:hypothetical protein